MQLEPGHTLNATFRIERLLGHGGMGCVYAAYDQKLDRRVALKILTAVMDGQDRERFTVEAKALCELRHKGICAVYKLGTLPNGTPYLVLEYVEGETLRKLLLRSRTMPWREAAKLIINLCEALQPVHSAGIVHRDIKPENIMLSAEGPKLIDFGLCRLPDQHLTQPGFLVGTVMYISPEQCSGLAATALSDIYSLGCVLFELLTGQTPFEADNAVAMVHLQAFAEPPNLSTLGECSRELQGLVQRCLAKNPKERPASATELSDELSRLIALPDDAFSLHAGRPNIKAKDKSHGSLPKIAAGSTIVCLAAVLASTPLTCFLLSHYPSPAVQSFALYDAQSMRSLHNYNDSYLLASALATSIDQHNGDENGASSRLRMRRSLAELNADIKERLPSQLDKQLLSSCLLDLHGIAERSPDVIIDWKDSDFDNYETLISCANTGDQFQLLDNLNKMRDISKSVWIRCVNSTGQRKNPQGLERAHLRAFEQMAATLKSYPSEKLQLNQLQMRWEFMRYSSNYVGTLKAAQALMKESPDRKAKHQVLFAMLEEHEHAGNAKEGLLAAKQAMEMNSDLPEMTFLRSLGALKCAELAHLLGDTKSSQHYLQAADALAKSVDSPKDRNEFADRRRSAITVISSPR